MEQLLVVSGRKLVKIGKITGSVGIKGDMKIVPVFFNAIEVKEILSQCSKDICVVSSTNFPKKINILDVQERGTNLVLKALDVNSRTVSDSFKGFDVYVDYELCVEYLKKTDNILRLVGYSVVDNELGYIGVVKKVIRSRQTLISLDENEEKIFPFVNDLIESIDDDNKTIKTKLPLGIFE